MYHRHNSDIECYASQGAVYKRGEKRDLEWILGGSLGSRLGIFHIGWATACLELEGTIPSGKKQFTIANKIGQSVLKTSLSREGMISEIMISEG